MSLRMRIEDLFTGASPLLASITLAQWNQIAGIFGALVGAAYVIWKWRMDALKERELKGK